MSHVEWEKIKAEYLQGGTSQRKLAEKYGISYNTFKDRASREAWAKQREEIHSKSAAKAQQKIVSQRAKDIELLDKSRTLLIQKLHSSIEKFPDIPGNRMEQSITEMIAADGDPEDKTKKKIPKQKTVRFESDLVKLVQTLDKLMALTGYVNTGENDVDDGFMGALHDQALEVAADDTDIPEDS